MSDPVRATLEDGQILAGQVRSIDVNLVTPLGNLAIPIGHIGEIEPIEGGQLEDSHNHVKVWLRNGSELVGQWDNPELEFNLAVGDEWVEVDLPMDELERFQLRDRETWPKWGVFVVNTDFGDDFIVDANTTKFTLENDLGVFSPYLSECRSIEPLGDGSDQWQVNLNNGSTLRGTIAGNQFLFTLPMGPEEISVPLVHVTSIQRQEWSEPTKRPASTGWFDNSSYRQQKRFKSLEP